MLKKRREKRPGCCWTEILHGNDSIIIVDLMSEIIGIPAGLIMRHGGPDIEVFISSNNEGNPYHPGDKEKVWNSGLYCETAIKTEQKLLVPNALADKNWKDNPDTIIRTWPETNWRWS